MQTRMPAPKRRRWHGNHPLPHLWPLLRTPLRILLSGAAALLVLAGARLAGLPPLCPPSCPRSRRNSAALLVFAVGLAFAAFLWWLAARSFAFLRDPAHHARAVGEPPRAAPRPAGRHRPRPARADRRRGRPAAAAVQPGAVAERRHRRLRQRHHRRRLRLLFRRPLHRRRGHRHAPPRRGARRPGPPRGSAARRERRAQGPRRRGRAAAGARPGQLAAALDTLGRQIAIAGTLLETLGPALPPGLLPAGAADALQRARAVAAEAARPGGGRGRTPLPRSPRVLDAAAALSGRDGAFATLLRTAAGALPAIAGGPLAAVSLLLGLGWQAGSAAWRRWRAQVLAAPHDPTLFDPGSITPSSAALRLENAPLFAAAFASLRDRPGFAADLLDIALATTPRRGSGPSMASASPRPKPPPPASPSSAVPCWPKAPPPTSPRPPSPPFPPPSPAPPRRSAPRRDAGSRPRPAPAPRQRRRHGGSPRRPPGPRRCSSASCASRRSTRSAACRSSRREAHRHRGRSCSARCSSPPAAPPPPASPTHPSPSSHVGETRRARGRRRARRRALPRRPTPPARGCTRSRRSLPRRSARSPRARRRLPRFPHGAAPRLRRRSYAAALARERTGARPPCAPGWRRPSSAAPNSTIPPRAARRAAAAAEAADGAAPPELAALHGARAALLLARIGPAAGAAAPKPAAPSTSPPPRPRSSAPGSAPTPFSTSAPARRRPR